jgi:hypothetical protein
VKVKLSRSDAPAAVKPRRCKSKDRLTLTLPVLNPNAKPCSSLDIDVYVVVLPPKEIYPKWGATPITETKIH